MVIMWGDGDTKPPEVIISRNSHPSVSLGGLVPAPPRVPTWADAPAPYIRCCSIVARNSHPSVSLGGLVPAPPRVPTWADAPAPYIRCRSIVGPPHPRVLHPQTLRTNFIYQIITLSTSDLHSGICQLYLNKAGKNIKRQNTTQQYSQTGEYWAAREWSISLRCDPRCPGQRASVDGTWCSHSCFCF